MFDDANHVKLQADHLFRSHILLIHKVQQAQRDCHLMGVDLHNVDQVYCSDWLLCHCGGTQQPASTVVHAEQERVFNEGG